MAHEMEKTVYYRILKGLFLPTEFTLNVVTKKYDEKYFAELPQTSKKINACIRLRKFFRNVINKRKSKRKSLETQSMLSSPPMLPLPPPQEFLLLKTLEKNNAPPFDWLRNKIFSPASAEVRSKACLLVGENMDVNQEDSIEMFQCVFVLMGLNGEERFEEFGEICKLLTTKLGTLAMFCHSALWGKLPGCFYKSGALEATVQALLRNIHLLMQPHSSLDPPPPPAAAMDRARRTSILQTCNHILSLLISLNDMQSVKSHCSRNCLKNLFECCVRLELIAKIVCDCNKMAGNVRKLFEDVCRAQGVEEVTRLKIAFEVLLEGKKKTPSYCGLILQECIAIISPKKRVPDVTVNLQRAATQEEYFRGNLTKSTFSTLNEIPRPEADAPPLMKDLRNKIAKDLGMLGSVEMIEFLVAGKIVAQNLPIHEVFEAIWIPYLQQQREKTRNQQQQQQQQQPPPHGRQFGAASSSFSSSTAAASAAPRHIAQFASALFPSGMFSTHAMQGIPFDDEEEDEELDSMDGEEDLSSREGVDKFAKYGKSAMMITYRLCAVDGEATEDFVSSLDALLKNKQQPVTSARLINSCLGDAHLCPGVFVCVAELLSSSLPTAAAPTKFPQLMAACFTFLNEITLDNNEVSQVVSTKTNTVRVILQAITALKSDKKKTQTCLEILSRLINNSEHADMVYNQQDIDSSLEWVIEMTNSQDEKLVSISAKLIPHLTKMTNPVKIEQIARKIHRSVVNEEEENRKWANECLHGLAMDATENHSLRDLLTKIGLLDWAVQHLSLTRNWGSEGEMVAFVLDNNVKVLLALKTLKGLIRGNEKNVFDLETGNTRMMNLIKLEEIPNSTIAEVGSAADEVLQVLHTSPSVADFVTKCQRVRKEEKMSIAQRKKNMLMKKRKNSVAFSGNDLDASTTSSDHLKKWKDELAALGEEETIVCAVCREGVKSNTNMSALSVYVFNKAVKLPSNCQYISCRGEVLTVFPGNPPWAVTTVSCFICIHVNCHDTAARADRIHPKAPKEQWEGAAIRNGHVKCNNLIPMNTGSHQHNYEGLIQTYYSRMDKEIRTEFCTNSSTSTGMSLLSVTVHDLRFLLLRMANQESFSVDTNGGGLESNFKLIPPLLQMIKYLLLNDNAQFQKIRSHLSTFDKNEPFDVAFFACASLVAWNRDEWNASREDFFKAFVLFGLRMQAQQVAFNNNALNVSNSSNISSSSNNNNAMVGERSRARSRGKSLTPEEDDATLAALPDYIPKHLRPWILCFAIVDFLHANGNAVCSHFEEEVVQYFVKQYAIWIANCGSIASMLDCVKVFSLTFELINKKL